MTTIAVTGGTGVLGSKVVEAYGAATAHPSSSQFHEFAGQMLERSPGPVGLVPKMLSQTFASLRTSVAPSST